MFPDWYSKNAPVIQLLLIVLGVKEQREGSGGGGGRVEPEGALPYTCYIGTCRCEG